MGAGPETGRETGPGGRRGPGLQFCNFALESIIGSELQCCRPGPSQAWLLPDGFQKIRYFGLMANRGRAANLALCRELIPDAAPGHPALEVKDWTERYRQLTGEDPRLCPACKRGRLIPKQALLPLTWVQTKGVTAYDTS